MMTKLSEWLQRILRYAPAVATIWQRVVAVVDAIRLKPTSVALDAPIQREVDEASAKLVELQTRAAARKASIEAKKQR